MADDLDDGEFWLPPHFLTDEDILFDFNLPIGSGSGSDLDIGSIETESDEDDLVIGLTRCSLHSKVLSTSPKSTLCGCVDGSSRASPNPPISPPPPVSTDKESAATLDLLFKAAGEVARIKMNNEKTTTAPGAGTGFFDRSNNNNNNKGPFCPPSRTAPFYSHLQFPPLSHLQPIRQRQQIMNNSNNLLGLGPTAWPPLQAQTRPVHRLPPMVFPGQFEPKRESVGTGVFLPRRVTSPIETRKKPEVGGSIKMKSGKGSSQSQRKKNARPVFSNQNEIRLPQEWSY